MGPEYKCVLSLGIRCFTEIFLKELGFKKFSSPFDGLFLSSINDIIYLLEHKIEDDKLIHTQDDDKYKLYNERWGNRTLHKIFDKDTNIDKAYHNATFPHHNLKEQSTYDHFKKCFNRFDIIEKNKIKTLFCFFIHPTYPGYRSITIADIEKLANYLKIKYNCHLLAIYFFKTNTNENYSLLKNTDNLSIYKINNNSHELIDVKQELIDILNKFKIQSHNLLTYDYFNLNIKQKY